MTAGLNPPSHRLSVAVTGCKRSKAGAGGKISGVSGNPYGADDFMVGRTNAFAVNYEPGTSRGTGGPSIGHARRNRPPRGRQSHTRSDPDPIAHRS